MCDKRDSQKKRFIEALTASGTISHAARAAGVSRWTVYRWRSADKEFREDWDYALEEAIDAIESTLYQSALAGNTLAAIYYLKAHRPQYRDRLPSVDVRKLNAEIEEGLARLNENCRG